MAEIGQLEGVNFESINNSSPMSDIHVFQSTKTFYIAIWMLAGILIWTCNSNNAYADEVVWAPEGAVWYYDFQKLMIECLLLILN